MADEEAGRTVERDVSNKDTFLRRSPDPCESLTLDKVQSIIGSNASAMAGNGSSGVAGGVCNYLDGTSGKQLGVSIQFRPHTLVDSNSMTEQELIAASEKMKGIPGAGFIYTEGPGMANTAFVSNRQTYLDVYTGIGGAGAIGNDIVSEVVLHYAIADPSRSGDENLNILIGLADSQLSRLSEYAQVQE